MKKKLVLALLTVAAVSVAHAQDATSPSATATPAPKAAVVKKKKKHKTKAAEAQKSNVLVPTGAGVGDGARVQTPGQPNAAETNIENISPSTAQDTSTNPPKNGSIDDEITNKKLRAANGSLSKYSISTAITYSAGTLHQPFGATRPSLSPGDPASPVSLSGTIAGKYRLTEHDNLNVGTGVNWVNPWHANPPSQDTDYDHLEVSDPYFSYSRLFKALGLQNIFTATFQYYTSNVASVYHDTDGISLDYVFLYGIGKSGVEVGLDTVWGHDFFSQNTNHRPVDVLELYPFLEWEFVKNFSFRTVYWGLRYYNTQDNTGALHHRNVAQSAGIGIAVTRDIYLYPNVQWNWEHQANWRNTNVSIATNINAF